MKAKSRSVSASISVTTPISGRVLVLLQGLVVVKLLLLQGLVVVNCCSRVLLLLIVVVVTL